MSNKKTCFVPGDRVRLKSNILAIQLWREPTTEGQRILKNGFESRGSYSYQLMNRVRTLKGIIFARDDDAIVISVIQVQCFKYGTRPACLLLTQSNQCGWCIQTGTLAILSPACEV